MKTKQEVEKALGNLLDSTVTHSAMTYEQGVEEALAWVIGDIEDDEFEYFSRQ